MSELPGIEFGEIHPCDGCGGPLVGNTASGLTGNFYRVTIESALPDPNAMRTFVGLSIQLGSEQLAGAFAPKYGAQVFGKDTLLLCFTCATGGSVIEVLERTRKEEVEG